MRQRLQVHLVRLILDLPRRPVVHVRDPGEHFDRRVETMRQPLNQERDPSDRGLVDLPVEREVLDEIVGRPSPRTMCGTTIDADESSCVGVIIDA
jgi:hypothetical protein